MKNMILAILVLFTFSPMAGQHSPEWAEWDTYIGKWIGEGSGIPGEGGGSFTFTLDLDNNILVRRSHSEYPGPGGIIQVHEDLMIISKEPGKKPANAVYFDNEGHTIHYTVSYEEGGITLTSGAEPGAPFFRLVYSMVDEETCNTRFEISQDGKNFSPYVEGKSKRVK